MAAKKVVVGGSSVSASQLKDLFRQIEDGSLKGYHIQGLLEHRNPFEFAMETVPQLKRACDLCFDAFGVAVDPASVKIPERQAGRDRLIVIPKGLAIKQVVVFLRTMFNVELYVEDLDGDVAKNDRTSAETYAIWVGDVVDADEEFKNLSANDLAAKNIPGVTLMERLLHEALYFRETGKHLDVGIWMGNWKLCFDSHNSEARNHDYAGMWTLCFGSRSSVGDVPSVAWGCDRKSLLVRLSTLQDKDNLQLPRAVVS